MNTRRSNLVKPLLSNQFSNFKTLSHKFCISLILTLFSGQICLLSYSDDSLNYRVLFIFCIIILVSFFCCHPWHVEHCTLDDHKNCTSAVQILQKILWFHFKFVIFLTASSTPYQTRVLHDNACLPASTLLCASKGASAVRVYAWRNCLWNAYEQFEFSVRHGLPRRLELALGWKMPILDYHFVLKHIHKTYYSCLPVFRWCVLPNGIMSLLSVSMSFWLQFCIQNLIIRLKNQLEYIQNMSI